MTTQIPLMQDLDLQGLRTMIRLDLNVPIKDGDITSDARIRAAIPTIELALAKGAKVIMLSHLGRPDPDALDGSFTLQPVAQRLEDLLGRSVHFCPDWLNGITNHEITLCENTRYLKGEKLNDDSLSEQIASLCDVFVMDAFGTAHRAQASTHGVARFAPVACAGPLLVNELENLEKALKEPARPMVAIVGGSKVSTKLEVLDALSDKVDQLVVGGGIANTFLAAAGTNVGKSLCEHDLIPAAKKLMEKCDIPIPTDVITGKKFDENEPATLRPAYNVGDDDMIFDIGPVSSACLAEILKQAGTIIWNGPVGVFEFDQFADGTEAIAEAIAESDAFSIAGGGDTLAAIDKFGIADKVSYISTGGGAFLEYVEGKVLPAVAILEERAKG